MIHAIAYNQMCATCGAEGLYLGQTASGETGLFEFSEAPEPQVHRCESPKKTIAETPSEPPRKAEPARTPKAG